MTKDKKPVGRPPSNTSPNDRAVSFTVSCTPNEKKRIEKKYGTLTAALKSLLK